MGALRLSRLEEPSGVRPTTVILIVEVRRVKGKRKRFLDPSSDLGVFGDLSGSQSACPDHTFDLSFRGHVGLTYGSETGIAVTTPIRLFWQSVVTVHRPP
jgi:hypothetical protein